MINFSNNFNRMVAAMLLALAAAASAEAQQPVVSYSPANPKWGDTVTLIYDMQAKGAKFSITDDLYFAALIRNEDYSESKISGKATKDGTRFQYSFPVKDGSAFIFARFITPSQWDKDNDARFMILNKEGKPARNAHLNSMYAGKGGAVKASDLLPIVEREIQAHPENYAAYVRKWQFSPPGTLKETIHTDLRKIEETRKGEPAEYLAATFNAALMMKDEAAARAVFTKMVRQFPASPLIEQAFTEYDKAAFMKQIPSTNMREISQLKKDAATLAPSSPLARSMINFLITDEEKAYDLAEKISRAWASEEPMNPLPLYRLATVLEKQAKAEAANEAINRSITGLLNGDYRIYENYAGSGEQNFLAAAFRLKARLAFTKELFGEALAAVAYAKRYQEESDPRAAELEAQIWSKLGRLDKVEDAYVEAMRNGSKTAEAMMKELYAKRRGSLDGFEAYLVEKKKSTPIGAETGAAPAFTATAIDGKTYDLASLRGKTVVLNFWFVGCPGCDVEIPALNRLVAEFKDVVFLSFALDDKATIEKYFKEKPFHYATVASATAWAEKYSVTGFPTHIIIDKEGRIRGRKIGGSEKSDDDLRPLIKAAQ